MYRIKRLWPHMVYQSLFAMIFICVVLYFLNLVATSNLLWAVGAGSLSSSCFIVFTRPSGTTASPKNIVGGYLVGMIVGILMRMISGHLHPHAMGHIGSPHFQVIGMLAAVAVGLAFLIMALLELEHPPAMGIALVLVLDVRDYFVLMIIFAAVLILVLLRIFLRRVLLDLY